MKENDYKIYKELMKNPRGSDRTLAKAAGVSQPTVTRRREILLNQLRLSFVCVPDFSKIGFSIASLTEVTCQTQEQQEVIINLSNVLMAMKSTNSITLLSVHQDFKAYNAFAAELQRYGFVMSTKLFDTATGIIKPFDTRKTVGEI